MAIDHYLIQKVYFEKFTESTEGHPIRILAEELLQAKTDEDPDLSEIRFAQGEVYFQNKDYETAIFKWGKVSNDLQPWAIKNTADAYYELGDLENAEQIYKSVAMDNGTLFSEVALQLFSLYLEQGKAHEADQEIKRAVDHNPDYPNVSEIARAFFEEQHDWDSAVSLAVKEAGRTHDLQWFDIVKTYVDKGFTKPLPPAYFSEVLIALNGIDNHRFEQLSVSLWKSYKNQDVYFEWIRLMNELLLNVNVDTNGRWHDLSAIYKETYVELIDGRYLLYRLEDLIPDLLTNWVIFTDSKQALFASSSVLSWNEIFPGTISQSIVAEAETILYRSKGEANGMEEAVALFELIADWADSHDLPVGHRLEWIVRELTESSSRHILTAGSDASGKAAFVNTMLEGELVTESASVSVIFKDHERFEIAEMKDREMNSVADLADYRDIMERRRLTEGAFIEFKLPSPFLYENSLTIIDVPDISSRSQQELFRYLPLADRLLYVVNAGTPLTNKEHELFTSLKEYAPDLKADFILTNIDEIGNEDEIVQAVDSTWSRIQTFFPNARIFAFAKNSESRQQLKDISEFVNSGLIGDMLHEDRLEKLLFYIRQTITTLLQNRIELENSLIESIRWNDEMSGKLNGAINQLSDIESEKSKVIKKSFRKIKEEMRLELANNIPALLKDSSSTISEESDFGKIHLELNEEMNRRISEYIQDKLLPKFHVSMEDWIAFSSEEFSQSQSYLDEMAEGFNSMFGEEKLSLDCDFKILEDWRRDAARLTSRVQVEPVNILLRFTPSQFILKSAGKLFGAIQQNKSMLYNKYKTFVETEEYSETTKTVTESFIKQFELFENSLERDVTLFFKNPMIELKDTVEETYKEIKDSKERLEKIQTNPEMYRDPLTLFEVRLRQQEWSTLAGKGVQSL